MNQEEFELFKLQEEIVLESTNSKYSFKSNLFLIKRNFDKIRIRLAMLHKYTTYVYNLINLDVITQNILDKISSDKLTLEITVNLLEGTSIIQSGYKISRLVNNQVNIERQLKASDWLVDKLMVTLKNVDGQVIYPTIFTRNNKIEIYFLDGISSNYTISIL